MQKQNLQKFFNLRGDNGQFVVRLKFAENGCGETKRKARSEASRQNNSTF